jgi:hypothetical protein
MTAPVARTVRLAAAALVLTIVVGLAACGVSSQHTATRIESDDVPFGLLDDETTTTAVDAGRTTSVYLLSKDRLVPVDRSVPDDATLEDLLDQVITGPTEVEQSLGITTAVPAGTVASVDTSRGIAEVDLTSRSSTPSPASPASAACSSPSRARRSPCRSATATRATTPCPGMTSTPSRRSDGPGQRLLQVISAPP